MLGRTFLVVLFFWAALTIITPILVRMSASAKLLDYNGETKSQSSNEIRLSSRRALGSTVRPQTERPASEPTPAPALAPTRVAEPHGQITFELEVARPTYIQTKMEIVT